MVCIVGFYKKTQVVKDFTGRGRCKYGKVVIIVIVLFPRQALRATPKGKNKALFNGD